MHKHDSFLTTVLLASAAVAVPAGSAGAQNRSGLEEVVVTAQKRSESLQDVPISITAVTTQDLQTAGALDAGLLQRLTPGLQWYVATGLNSIYLRGIGSNLPVAGLDNGVLLYVDSVLYPTIFGTAANMVDVERVEVLKGPQGTLFGRNATGGVIRILTNDVSDTEEATVKVSYGNYDAMLLSGVLNVPVNDRFGFRIAAQSRERDGFRRNISYIPGTLERVDGENNEDVRIKAKWKITDSATLDLMAGFAHREDTRGQGLRDVSEPGLSVAINAGGITGRNPEEVALALTSPTRGDTLTAGARLSVDIGEYTFISDTTYADEDFMVSIDSDATTAFTNGIAYIYNGSENFQQDFQLLSPSGEKLEWIFGLYGYYQDTFDEFDINNQAGLPPRSSYGHQRAITVAWAPYGQATWHFNDQWALTLGGRYSSEKKDILYRRTSRPGYVTLIPGTPVRADDEWNAFTPKATLEYHLSGDTMMYTTWARGFKSGGFQFPVIGSQPLDQEKIDMYELGFKGTVGNFRYSTSLYNYDYRDLQVQQYLGNGTVQSQNAGEAPVTGLEADFDWAVTDNFTLNGGFEWLISAEYKKFPNAAGKTFLNAAGVPTAGTKNIIYNADGHPLLYAPDVSGNLTGTYTFAIGGGTAPLSSTVSYKGVYYTGFDVDYTVERVKNGEDYLWSMRWSYIPASERWSVGLWVNNILDANNEMVYPLPSLRATYEDPRTYGVDFSIKL